MKKEERKDDLHVAFDEIERGDGRVSQSTAEGASSGARGVVHRRVHRDLPFLVRSSGHHSSSSAQALARVWAPARNNLCEPEIL